MLLGASWPSGWEQRLASQLSSKTWLGPMAALASAVSLAQDPMAILFEHHAVVVDQERHHLRISILGRIAGSCSLGPAEALPGAVFPHYEGLTQPIEPHRRSARLSIKKCMRGPASSQWRPRAFFLGEQVEQAPGVAAARIVD